MDNKTCECGCNCDKCQSRNDGHSCHGMCGGMCCGGHHHGMGRWIVKVLVVLFIFWCGVQFGELRGMLRSAEFGGRTMMGNRGDAGYGAYGMMNAVYGTTAQATTTTR